MEVEVRQCLMVPRCCLKRVAKINIWASLADRWNPKSQHPFKTLDHLQSSFLQKQRKEGRAQKEPGCVFYCMFLHRECN
ncbi:hypothetical protein CEXT_683321 [Caerostris extrusa]|uniref:Uncharacterized protein n=1 Tax=Caerostris extrusa TaxID=172846 RepID=A0AAV4P6Y2_CAEEX|nr:hypothetical protein CEXT_683321 [Caerostris extrusa]